MSAGEVAILGGALVLTGLLAWYFFGPKKSRQAELADGVQIIKVTVRGGYSPDVVQVASGVPVRLLFDRQESGDCSSRVVFPDFKVNQTLPAFETTMVEFLPGMPGEYGFGCGMGMLYGRLRVVGDAASPAAGGTGSVVALAAPPPTREQSCHDELGAGPAQPVARATVTGNVQVVDITVKGGYSPEVVRVVPGIPVRLVFDRPEDSACSARLLVPDLGVDVALPEFERTTVALAPMEEGVHELGLSRMRRVSGGHLQPAVTSARRYLCAQERFNSAGRCADRVSPCGVVHFFGRGHGGGGVCHRVRGFLPYLAGLPSRPDRPAVAAEPAHRVHPPGGRDRRRPPGAGRRGDVQTPARA